MTATRKRTLRSAVIGTGKISDEHLSFVASDPDVELAGVCDLSACSAQFAAERFGAAAHFTSHAQMLERCKPDVVHVLTPPATHDRLARDCLDAGAHVIVEKPIALDSEAFESLWAEAEGYGLRIVENHNYRFNGPIQTVHDLMTRGELGDVTDVEVRLSLPIRNEGGRYADENLPAGSHQLPAGVIHEFVTHLAYLTLLFTGGFDSTRATWSNHGGGDLFKYDDLDALVLRGATHARIRFTCQTFPDAFTVTVRGTEGMAVADLFLPHVYLEKPRVGGDKLSPMVNRFVNGTSLMKTAWTGLRDKVMQRTAYEGLTRFLEGTYEAFRTGGAPPVTHDDMRMTVRLVDALLVDAGRRDSDLRMAGQERAAQ